MRALTLDVADPAEHRARRPSGAGGPGAAGRAREQRGHWQRLRRVGDEPDFDAIQRALDTNFFGAYRLTIALLDLLRASGHPRIVNVSSGMGGVAEMGGWSPGLPGLEGRAERA